MIPNFWKLSQSPDYFTFAEMVASINDGLVYLHRNTNPMGTSGISQAQHFIDTPVGDYFYLTNGNEGIFLLGQFTGPSNIFSKKGNGWLDRPFRLIRSCKDGHGYSGAQKWWTPNFNSSYVQVPTDEIKMFEEEILKPFFDLNLSDFGLK